MLSPSPYLDDGDVRLYHGDVLQVLQTLPSESVHCALTSPPFYALRDYGVEGQIGLEESPDEWAARLVDVFREVRRVLHPAGTLWVECGDSYNANQGAGFNGQKRQDHANRHTVMPRPDWLKPKDLLGQPWLLAFALRSDGWWLRQAIIWHKPNAMPESATDRCTTAHSYVFLLSKSARYHFDAEAIAEPAEWARWGDQTVDKYEGTDTKTGWMQSKTKPELRSGRVGRYQQRAMYGEGDGTTPRKLLDDPRPPVQEENLLYVNPGNRATNGKRERDEQMRGFDNRLERADGLKNPRSVWTIPTRGYPEAHFATWPEALVRKIILAGCPEGGTVLDPFVGSGTTCKVARDHGRRSIGIDLNANYLKLAAKRLQQQSLLTQETA